MLKESIKKELDQRGWSVLKLSKETGIRYPSLSEYFADRKELNSKNIEIVLTTLNLKIMSAQSENESVALKAISDNNLSCSVEQFLEKATEIMNRNWDKNISCTGESIRNETISYFAALK
jgi:hypothetical protein